MGSPLSPQSAFGRLLTHPSSGGIVLMFAAALALGVANSGLAGFYFETLATRLAGLSVLHWINDGLMTVFFLMVGLEIKREAIRGELSSWSGRILPGAAALGGMIGPAAIYLALNRGASGQLGGWAIPAATDIAFALGVLSLLGPRVPTTLKVFLTALAIIDDLGAVLIIALFYAGNIDAVALSGAAVLIAALLLLNRRGVSLLWPYLTIGMGLWLLVLMSGIHATLAGVVLAFAIPLKALDRRTNTVSHPLERLEHRIAGWVTFLIVPVFGFANAGVSFAGTSLGTLAQPVPLGIAAGLFFGKQAGVFLICAATIRMGWAELPARATWQQLYGVAVLCGIGFTMSLFIGLLAFPDDPALQSGVKLGVLLGSLLSAIVGAVVLRGSSPHRKVVVD